MTARPARADEASGLRVETDGPVTRFVFDRPHAMNAYSPGLVAALNAALEAFALDDSRRVLIVTGAGRAFCCGADLKFLYEARERATEVGRFLRDLNRFIDDLDALDRPVIAAVNGYAMGGGLETMLACDIVMAADDAVIVDPHITIAAIHGAGGSQRLVRTVGLQRALDLVLTARKLDAAEAAAWGLVSRVVPRGGLDAAAMALAHELADRDPATVRKLKRLVRLSASADLGAGLAAEREAYLEGARQPAFVAGLERFARRGPRPPDTASQD